MVSTNVNAPCWCFALSVSMRAERRGEKLLTLLTLPACVSVARHLCMCDAWVEAKRVGVCEELMHELRPRGAVCVRNCGCLGGGLAKIRGSL